MRSPLKKLVLCHLTYGFADPVDLRWGQPRYVTLKGLKRQKELGALVTSIDGACGGCMWTLRLDTTGMYPAKEDSRTGMGIDITDESNEAIVEEICLGEGLDEGVYEGAIPTAGVIVGNVIVHTEM
ncbi:hypothetical protein TrST_g8627 [Triparma strigata]|uniref:Uncharacterized protein n=1 Tax=Triparma strigata TaxID=1606541 RepID=A0A9W7BZ62_9STRA|nr:hypothetical protein TrST_g8627 [Triparma strigata]